MSVGFIQVVQYARNDYAHAFFGGSGTVSGTVKIGSVPARRRVRLYDASTGVLIREKWSETDGSYSFTGLKMEYRYTVTATDYNGDYNDVIAANLTPV
jgi:hypothetical protein